MALENRVRLEADGILVALGFQVVVQIGQGEGCIAPEEPTLAPVAIPRHDRLQHRAPVGGAVDVAGTQGGAFQVAKLVEDEQRMVAGATEMAVVGGTFLLAVGGADTAVHVQHHHVGRAAGMNRVDPLPREIGQGGEVGFAGQHLGFEPSHLAGGCGFLDHRSSPNDPAHRRIMAEAVGVVHVLVPGKPTEHRLTELGDQGVATVLAGPAVGENLPGHLGQAEGIIQFAESD